MRPLAKAKTDWAYAMSLPSSSEEAMVFLLFLVDLLPRSTFSVAFFAGRGRRSFEGYEGVAVVARRATAKALVVGSLRVV